MSSRTIERKLERLEEDLRAVQRQLGKQSARKGGGGGGLTIATHTTFPAIPTTPTLISCKGQLWYAESGYTVWQPTVLGTTQAGTPGT